MKKIRLRIKQFFCNHEFKALHEEVFIGVTLNWTLRPTNEYQDTYKCSKCGKEEKRQYIYFGR